MYIFNIVSSATLLNGHCHVKNKTFITSLGTDPELFLTKHH